MKRRPDRDSVAMGFCSNYKGDGSERKQKINTYNIVILFLLAPASITYGYNESLHYFVATKPSRQVGFVTMGIDDDIITELCASESPLHLTALLSLVELYLACLFQA